MTISHLIGPSKIKKVKFQALSLILVLLVVVLSQLVIGVENHPGEYLIGKDRCYGCGKLVTDFEIIHQPRRVILAGVLRLPL